jgi:hypothetical protein
MLEDITVPLPKLGGDWISFMMVVKNAVPGRMRRAGQKWPS